MPNEDEIYIPISALQHFLFCPRQCALIHVERLWDDNRFTIEGKLIHQRVAETGSELRGEILVACSLPLRSERLRLVGIADTVEFHPIAEPAENAVRLPRHPGLWKPYPVEFKRGNVKPNLMDEIQLCAQAMALEEMLSGEVREGAIFYAQPRRRHLVVFETNLRKTTCEVAEQVHSLVQSGITPAAQLKPQCTNCSVRFFCLPSSVAPYQSLESYLRNTGEAKGG